MGIPIGSTYSRTGATTEAAIGVKVQLQQTALEGGKMQHETVMKLASHILEECDYEVISAKNGKEALEIYLRSGKTFDLLVTDVVMPEMSGRELADRLRENHPKLKVLFMSGYTDDTVIRHGIIDAKARFIQKPFTFDGFAKEVRGILDEGIFPIG